MPELHPTKARMRVLEGVARNKVTYYVSLRDSYLDGHGSGRRVTAVMAQLSVAGWVSLPDDERHGMRVWSLTDAGRGILRPKGGSDA